jgi:phage portal protein BeeE
VDWKNSIASIFGFNKNYNHFGSKIFGGANFGKLNKLQMLDLVLSSPAMLKVIALQCDMFSMGKIYYYENEKEVKGNRVVDLLNNPNALDNRSQFLWDFMFWNMLGNAYLFVHDKTFVNNTKLIFLNPHNIQFPEELIRPGLILSRSKAENLKKLKISYSMDNGKSTEIEYGDIIHYKDLSSLGRGNAEGVSRLDALYKIILNSEEALKSKNINTRFSGKFMVSGKTDAMDITKRMMSKEEKSDIEEKVESNGPVTALKSLVEIRRFVENMKNMELSESYKQDYFLIGNMYNIPRDVLEAFNSSTYENQEKARNSHVSYCLEPKGEDFMNGLTKYFELSGQLVMSWDHLPFVQVMEEDREKVKKLKLENLDKMLAMGIPQEQALKYLDLDFKPFRYEQRTTNPGATEESSGTE